MEALLGTMELNLDQLDGVSGGIFPPGTGLVKGSVSLREMSEGLLREVRLLGFVPPA